jgi:4-hydroxy-3-polyprenylbenzoate decarboxylase
MKSPPREEVWRALHAAIDLDRGVGKIVIAVDDDIDPENLDAVFWAVTYRSKPHLDMFIIPNRVKGHGPPFKVDEPLVEAPNDSALLVDATLKEPFPPLALPKKEYMERAKEIWEELDMPPLKPESPWFGYLLPQSQWSEENEQEAELALKGDHYVTGAKRAEMKVKV